MAAPLDDPEIRYALVSLKTGTAVGSSEVLESARLQDLCAAAPELFRAGAASELTALLARLSGETACQGVHEIVFMSQRAVHVVQRVACKPDLALVAVCEDGKKLGLMLSGVHARALQLEAQPDVEAAP
jgi:hypothetical protein